MMDTPRFKLAAVLIVLITALPCAAQDEPLSRKALMAEFQKQRIVPEQGGFMFAQGKFPALRWEQPLVVREVWGSVLPLHVRWFDAEGNEVEQAEKTGRYAAYIEAHVPDGPVIRRARTFYAFDLQAMMQMFREGQQQRAQDIDAPVGLLSESAGKLIHESYQEFARETINKHLLGDEKGAILFAAAAELAESDRPANELDHPMVRHQEHHLAIRRKLLGIEEKYPALDRPVHCDQPAIALREGTPAAAGFSDELPAQLRALCERWASEGGEPFTLVVARGGVVVFHEAFGRHEGADVTRDTAYPMFSITKSMTGMMAALFIDQGLLRVDQPIGEVLADFPTEGSYVPTFRDCLMHTSGIEGQIAFDGLDNPWMDNVIANGWDVHEQQYHYSGTAMDVVGQAMAIVSGKSVPRLFYEHLFEPLAFENARVTGLGMGGHLRAIDLAKLGQLLLNRGSYGQQTFFSEATYEQLLPRPYEELYPHLEVNDRAYGLAIRYGAERHPQAGKGDVPADATIFSPKTLGHGSFSGSIWRVDTENQIVVAMGRFASGEKHGQFAQELFMLVMAAALPAASGGEEAASVPARAP